jgi:hypothetical protein
MTRRPAIAFACFVVGVPLMFAGIALGVAVIASPDFLEGDRRK